jgi:hypothetical protein
MYTNICSSNHDLKNWIFTTKICNYNRYSNLKEELMMTISVQMLSSIMM